jgi:hypothetical protein
MRIGLTRVFVENQDKAEWFYTDVLRLQVKTSAPCRDPERGPMVVSPGEPDGVEVVLHLADEPAGVPAGGAATRLSGWSRFGLSLAAAPPTRRIRRRSRRTRRTRVDLGRARRTPCNTRPGSVVLLPPCGTGWALGGQTSSQEARDGAA